MVYLEGRSISANFYLANLTSYIETLEPISLGLRECTIVQLRRRKQ